MNEITNSNSGRLSKKVSKGKRYLAPLGYSLLGSIFLAITAFPGFMSYDSLQMVREARTSVEGGIYPTLPVYLFRFFDLLGNGNEAQFLAQNFVVLACFNLILTRLKIRSILILFANILIISNPLTMGAMLVLWKDVTLFALTSLVLLALVWRQTDSKDGRAGLDLKWLILLVIFLVAGMRLNALPIAIGLIVYWTFVYYPDIRTRLKFFIVSLLTIVSILFTVALQTVGLPELKVLKESGNVRILMATDLLGISKFLGESIVPFSSKADPEPELIPMSTIDLVYTNYGFLVMQHNAQHYGLDLQIFPKEFQENDLRHAWITAVISHPVEYAMYRLDIFGAIVGATVDRTYEPTHFNKIDANDLGISFEDRPITQGVLDYIHVSSGMWFLSPAFVWFTASSLVSVVVLSRLRSSYTGRFALSVYALGSIYLLTYLFLPATGEVRYAYPSTFLFFMSLICALQLVLEFAKTPKND